MYHDRGGDWESICTPAAPKPGGCCCCSHESGVDICSGIHNRASGELPKSIIWTRLSDPSELRRPIMTIDPAIGFIHVKNEFTLQIIGQDNTRESTCIIVQVKIPWLPCKTTTNLWVLGTLGIHRLTVYLTRAYWSSISEQGRRAKSSTLRYDFTIRSPLYLRVLPHHVKEGLTKRQIAFQHCHNLNHYQTDIQDCTYNSQNLRALPTKLSDQGTRCEIMTTT